MRTMRFLNLFLLSQREQRALRVPFLKPVTVIRAGNSMGKSAVLKSLYEAFGASPPEIDQPWRRAGVSIAVEFAIDQETYLIVKAGPRFAIFGQANLLVRTSDVEGVLAPFLADMLGFRLVLADRRDVVLIPPPSYMFAPFYVDQDKGWSAPWSSFDNLYLPRSKQILSEYHSGIKPNDYYVAMAERDKIRSLYQEILRERAALDRTYRRFREAMGEALFHYDMDDFQREVGELVSESEELHSMQAGYREKLSALSGERLEWRSHQRLLSKALAEMRSSFSVAATAPEQIECPTCGAQYKNTILERFGLIEHEDDLLKSMLEADSRLKQIEDELQALNAHSSEIAARAERVERVLQVRKEGITFGDIVTAESRAQASRIFRQRLTSLDQEANEKHLLIAEQSSEMAKAYNRNSARQIRADFSDLLLYFSKILDVRPVDKPSIVGKVVGRGSERPRSLLAYYYAFLHVCYANTSSCYCPIVLDAPNQQGQDEEHMPAIMRFIVQERPPGSQVIVGGEQLFGVEESANIGVVGVGNQKHGVLRGDQYHEVSRLLRPYLGNLL